MQYRTHRQGSLASPCPSKAALGGVEMSPALGLLVSVPHATGFTFLPP